MTFAGVRRLGLGFGVKRPAARSLGEATKRGRLARDQEGWPRVKPPTKCRRRIRWNPGPGVEVASELPRRPHRDARLEAPSERRT